mmetsp:Transcript_21858/g.36186  ORF Transcript_21858/g.36186 Transcript_21858/m.36186 type:complete len:449 (+) Transcript_21858:91-1437(+)
MQKDGASFLPSKDGPSLQLSVSRPCSVAFQNQLHTSLRVIPIIRSLRTALIGQSVTVLYWSDLGISIPEIFFLQMWSSALIVVLEIPSGYMSDHMGRRQTIIVSASANAIAFGLYGMSTGFLCNIAAESFLAIGSSMWSGTCEALLFETLFELGRSEEALTKESQTLFLAQATEAMSAIFGGVVATTISLRLTMWLTCLPFCIILVLVAMYVVEPVEEDNKTGSNIISMAGLRHQIKEVLHDIRIDLSPKGDLLLPFLVACIIFTACYTALWLHQMLWMQASMPLAWYGWSWALLNFSLSVGALLASKLSSFTGIYVLLGGLGLSTCFSFIAMGAITSPLWLLILSQCSMSLSQGILTPVITTYSSQRVGSNRRAMIMSILSLLVRILFASFCGILGIVAELYGLPFTCALAGCVLGGGAFCIMTICRDSELESASLQDFIDTVSSSS